MEGLLLRLTQLDAVAENAVRVISFFDQLTARRVSVDVLVAEASRLAECQVGVVDEDNSAPDGAVVHLLPEGTGAWLRRVGKVAPLDDILVERLAMSAGILGNRAVPVAALPDAELVRIVLSGSAAVAERTRALSLLGIEPDALVTVTALVASDVELAEIVESSKGISAQIGAVRAILTSGSEFAIAECIPAGVGPTMAAVDAPLVWQRARTAMRMARAAGRVVLWTELGAIAPIIERLRLEDIDGVPDVATLDLIEAEPGGPDTITILDAFCAADSVRHTATTVYRHHSTVANRLAVIGDKLGFCVTTVEGKERLRLALLLRYLRRSFVDDDAFID